MDKFTKSLNFPAKNAGFLFLQHNYLLSPRQTYSSDLYTLGIIIAKHKIRNTMPPHIIYCIPICAITIPQTADPKAVPKLAAVKKRPLAKSGASGAAVVIQYWLIFAFIPPKTPQSSVIKAIAGAEVPLQKNAA
jgi:hypothetical protein